MTIQAQYYHPDIRRQVNDFYCKNCQCIKIPCKGMGLLPKHFCTNTPWYKVAVDLIRPWYATSEHFTGESYDVLKCIDTTTNLAKFICIDTKSRDDIARKFEQTRLAGYPRLVCVVNNIGGKFTRYAFTRLLCILNVKDVPTTTKNSSI